MAVRRILKSSPYHSDDAFLSEVTDHCSNPRAASGSPAGMVSTIIPVFNRPELVRQAVVSVLKQRYRPIELILVNDGSTDETPLILDFLAEEYPNEVLVIHKSNEGPGAARQTGIDAARGEFIEFLDSDDLLLPEKFSLQVKGLRGDPKAGISYGVTLVEDSRTGERRVTHGTDRVHREIFPEVLSARLWATLTPLYRRSVCDAIGPWSHRRILEDWDYDCRAGLLGVKLHYCDTPVAVIRHGLAEHAGLAWQRSDDALRDRAAVYRDVLGYAQRAGIPPDAPAMRQFVRSLFWVARIAGSRGLTEEASVLYDLARENTAGPRWDYRVFGVAKALFGWKLAGRLVDLAHSKRVDSGGKSSTS